MNWPSFNAAPRILVNLSTNLATFPGDINKELPDVSPDDVVRRSISVAAPAPRPAAKPAKMF